MPELELQDRLQTALNELLRLEFAIQSAATARQTHEFTHLEAASLIAEIGELANKHIAGIQQRFIAGEITPSTYGESPRSTDIWLHQDHPVSSTLRHLSSLLGEAIIGYSMIQPIAARFRDSWVIANEGTTAHIARSHTQEYAAANGRITELFHGVIIWELDNQGQECQCTCPSCGIGICVGAASSRLILDEALAAARDNYRGLGHTVYPPRRGSAAEKAGLRSGDVISAVDGTRVDSYSRLATAIRNHAGSGQIRLKVLRGGDELTLHADCASDLYDERSVDNDQCIVPSGGEFSEARSNQLRQSFLQGTGNGGANGLASLTARELQILRLLTEGDSNSMIAAELVISRATVASHVANILAKLGLANRTEVATLATQAGLLT